MPTLGVQPEERSLTTDARTNDLKAFRWVLIVFAVTTVIAGIAVAFIPIGMDDPLFRQVSSALLLVGVCDSLVLRYWERLFRSRC